MSDQFSRLFSDMTEVFGEYGWREIPTNNIGEKIMSEEIIVEAESTEIVESPNNQITTNISGTTNPADFVSKSQEYAKALVDVVENQNLFAVIQGKKYVTFEGWQFLGSMLPTAITPQTEWTTELRDEATGETLGYKTRVVAKDVNGNDRGAAESVCMYSERNWAGKDANHLMSMAQTRASSKALRMALSSIVKLAGYEPTPKEEMDGITAENSFSNTGSTSAPTNNGGKASEKQLKFAKDMIRKNVDHELVQNDYYRPILEKIATGDISGKEVSAVLDWITGKTDQLITF